LQQRQLTAVQFLKAAELLLRKALAVLEAVEPLVQESLHPLVAVKSITGVGAPTVMKLPSVLSSTSCDLWGPPLLMFLSSALPYAMKHVK
jgi:hypothetical protein